MNTYQKLLIEDIRETFRQIYQSAHEVGIEIHTAKFEACADDANPDDANPDDTAVKIRLAYTEINE